MGSTDFGTQTQSFDFNEPADAENFNYLNYKLHQPGIYDGGVLSYNDSANVDISALSCYIEDPVTGNGVRISTAATVTLGVTSTTNWIVLRFAWDNIAANYMDFLAVAYASIAAGDIIVGKAVYFGASLQTTFDLTRRDTALVSELTTDALELKTQSQTTPAATVYVNGGTLRGAHDVITVTSGSSGAVTATTLGRHDIVWIDDAGAIQVTEGSDSGTPSAPDYSGKYVIAEIQRGASRTVIDGNEIIDVRPKNNNPLYELTKTTNGDGASLIGVEDSAAHFTGTTAETVFAELQVNLNTAVTNYALTTSGNGASLIGVYDVAGNFAGTTVEAVLAEIIADYAATTASNGASKIGVQDAAANYTAANVETVLTEIATDYPKFTELAATTGAGLIGIADAGLYFTATTVEGALQELAGGTYNPNFATVDISGILTVNTINEYTAASGVTIDGMLMKDNSLTMSTMVYSDTGLNKTGNIIIDSSTGLIYLHDDGVTFGALGGSSTNLQIFSGAILAIDFTSATAATFSGTVTATTVTGTTALSANTISERTAASGVTVDGVLLKDNGITLSGTLAVDTITENGTSGVDIMDVNINDGFITIGAGLTNQGTIHSGTLGNSNVRFDSYSTLAGSYQHLQIRKSASATMGTKAATSTTGILGVIEFVGVTGTTFTNAGLIKCTQDGAYGTALPGKISIEAYSSTGVNTDQLVCETDGSISMSGDTLEFSGTNADRAIDFASDASISWDESEDYFSVNKPMNCGTFTTTSTTATTLHTMVAGQTAIAMSSSSNGAVTYDAMWVYYFNPEVANMTYDQIVGDTGVLYIGTNTIRHVAYAAGYTTVTKLWIF